MKKSDFLRRMDRAATLLTQDYNSPNADKKSFDWGERALAHAQMSGLPARDEANDPIIRVLIVWDHGLTFETTILIEEAWECFQARMSHGVRDIL